MIEGLREFGPALIKGRRVYAHSVIVGPVARRPGGGEGRLP